MSEVMVNNEKMNNEKQVTVERIPNKAFDSEYMTEWKREVKYLATKGIRYTFVKTTPEYNIRQYKYRKTPELFIALAEFYADIRHEKEFNALCTISDSVKSMNAAMTAGEDPVSGCDSNG